MIAKFEKHSLKESSHISAHKYIDLLNLPHWHMEYELIFADKGKADVMIGSEHYLLDEGYVILIGSGIIHNIQSISESIISVIKIDSSMMNETFGNEQPACPLIKTELPMNEIFSELLKEFHSQEKYNGIICDCILIKMLAKLFGSCKMEPVSSSENNDKFKSLLKLIEEKYAYITFDEAAKFMCYSKPYFSRYFSRLSGMSFSSYLNIIRVAKAISMMRENKLNIT